MLVRRVIWPLLALTLYFLFSSLLGIHESYWDTLAMDQWRLHHTYLELGLPDGLLMLQNGHRPLIPAMLYLADLHWFGGRNLFLVGIGLVFIIGGLGLVSRMIWLDRETAAGARVGSICFLWILTFWLANGRNLVHGNETPFVGLPILLIALTSRSLQRGVESAGGGDRKAVARAALLVIALCLATTFTHGVGLILWLAVLVVAAIARSPIRLILFVLLATIGTYFLYFAVLPGNFATLAATDTPSVPFPDILLNAFHWLGAPLAHVLGAFSSVWALSFEAKRIGCIALGGFAFAVTVALGLTRILRPRPFSQLDVWAFITLATGCGMALQVAIWRQAEILDLPGLPAAPRYLIWVTCYWAALVALAGRRISRWRPRRRLATGSFAIVLLLAGCALIPSHLSSWKRYRSARYQIQDATLSLVLGVEDRELIRRFLFHNLAKVRRVAGYLQSRRLAMYRWPEATLIGEGFTAIHSLAPPDRSVEGKVKLTAFRAGDQTAGRIEGWLQPSRPERRPVRVVALDSAGQIRGVARFTRRQEGTLSSLGTRKTARRVGFKGYLKDLDVEEDYSFYVVFAGDDTAVELAAVPSRPSPLMADG